MVSLGAVRYRFTPWLTTPFDEPKNSRERNSNLTHAQERVIIEQVFGQLKRCFPILSSQMRKAVRMFPVNIFDRNEMRIRRRGQKK